MKVLSLLAAGAVVACSGAQTDHFKLQISAPQASTRDGDSTRLQMQAGDKLVVALVGIGAEGPITYSGKSLPSFAGLDGQLLTLAPARSQAGEYSLNLSATAG